MELANLDYKEKEIGGNTFYVRALPPLKSIELLGDLQAVVTTGIKVNVIAPGQENKRWIDKDINFGAIISGIGQNLRGAALVNFTKRLLNEDYVNVKCPGDESPVRLTEAKVNNLFTGKTKDLFALIYFVLEVNYEDFFGSWAGLTGLVQQLLSQVGNSPEPSEKN